MNCKKTLMVSSGGKLLLFISPYMASLRRGSKLCSYSSTLEMAAALVLHVYEKKQVMTYSPKSSKNGSACYLYASLSGSECGNTIVGI